jgi:F0F1-type ATP synthase membrane subunit b/b'
MSDAQLYLKIALYSQVLSAIVFIAVLIWMWFKWILPVIMAAQERSNKQIAEAERHRDEAREALTALQSDIEGAQRDAGLISERADVHAQHERDATLAEVTAAGERQVRDAEGELARARAVARQRLRDSLVAHALQIARREAPERLGAAGERHLVDAVIGSLETSRG